MRPDIISTKALVFVDVDVEYSIDRDGEIEICKVTLDTSRGENVTDLVTDGSFDSLLDQCEQAVREYDWP